MYFQFTSVIFWSIYRNIQQNGIAFSKSTYRFYRFKFRVSGSQIALTSSPMMIGPNSPNLNPRGLSVFFWGGRRQLGSVHVR